MFRALLIAFGLSLGFFIIYVLSMSVRVSGALVKFDEKLIAQCGFLKIAPGAEDIHIDRETGIAFVSASDRRAGKSAAPGGIYAFDGANPVQSRLVSVDGPSDFQPHGLYLWRGVDGDKRLFVVNHPVAGGHAIEIFKVGDGGAILHLETLAFAELSSPNDIVAVGPRSFYFTNDRGFTIGLLATAERYLMLPFSNAYYFNGNDAVKVAKWLNSANGINLSNDGSVVFIAEVVARKIGVYERNVEDGALIRRRSLPIKTGPDNIDVAPDGALWIGAHPKIFEYLKHAEDANYPAPSHVLKLDPQSGAVEDILISLDGRYSASTVATEFQNKLFVGSVFDENILVCPSSA